MPRMLSTKKYDTRISVSSSDIGWGTGPKLRPIILTGNDLTWNDAQARIVLGTLSPRSGQP